MRFTLVFVFVSLFCVRLFAQTNPLHDLDEGLTGQNINWNYNMGYRFTALSDGDITQLGGRWTNGVNHTVRLYSYPSGTLLESVVVTGDIDWNYVNLSSPRAVTAGEQFVVAVRLDAQSSGCYGPINGVPVSSGGISIEGGTYRSNSNAMPTNLITNTMYGQADITFEPCVYAGSLSADKMEIISGDSAILEVTDNVGSIQWQFSEDGVNYTDIIGETSAQLNTGSLDSSRLYRTYVTGGACANDTSNPIEIAVLDPFYPWRNQNESLTGEGFNWNYNLGYRFTCNQAGDVTQLGGRWANGVTATVRLYSYPAGTVLATAVVDGNIDWAFEDITPVSLTSGDEYVVAVRFQNGDNAGCYSNSLNFPIDDGGITITAGTYLFNSDNMPTNTVSGIIYGQPDIRFSPCSYAGSLVAANNNIEIYDSTNITAVSPIGDIQWQFSSDGITYTDLSGETDSVLNTGVLLSNTYFRTYVTSGICSPRDTSDAILIKVYDPLKPLQSYDPNITSSGNNWNYNMGYRFTALASGNVTELGGRWGDGVVNTVRLYSYPSGTLLANQNVTGNGDWSYATLGSPVALTANQQYVVSVRLNNNSDGVYSSGVSFPTTEGQIRIDNGTYISNSNAMPTNSNLTTVYGQADLKFEPCVYGGEVQGDDDLICSGEQTRFECDYYLGTSFQWQSSIDGISFTDIAGANDSAVQTGALTQTTYYRFIASHACGNDTSNIDSVVVVGTGGGLARTWNPTDGTDWSNTCNWLEGAVPVTGDSVIIPYGVNAPTAIPAVNLRYLLMDNVNDITINNNLRITSQLELSRGIINVSSTGSITLEYVASFVGGYSTSYINLANGAYVERIYTVADGSNFTIPIGQNELTPITFGLNATSSLGASPNIRFQVTDGIHPSLGSPSDYLNTFWTFSTNDISNLSYNFSCEYANSDIVGSELNLTSALYNSSSGWSQYSPALPLTNTIFGFFATEEGDLTASNEFPYISANTGDWNLITTWLGGSVPGLSNDVVIRNTHEVTLAGGQSAESITIENGGTLDLNGNTLSLYGDLNNDGDFDGENSTLLVLGSAAQTLSFQDSVNLDRLYSSNSSGASISSGVLYLTDNLELANGDFNTNDSLVLVSNASGTARILELPSGSSVNGDVQIQRFVPLGAGAFGNWHMLSSPISGQTLEGWNDDVFTSGFPGSDYNNPSYFISMYAYDETVAGVQDSGYVPPTNITNALGSGVGYWVYQFNQGVDVTYDLTGAIHEGNTNFSLSYTDDFVEPSSEHGWNLVGNPYPCTIDLEDADWTRSNISTTYYIWNPAAQNFATYTLGGASTNGGSRYVSSMQAIFVKANNASATLSCTEGVKVDVDPAFLKIVQPSNQFKLILSNGTSSDETIIQFNPSASLGFDPSFDAHKLQSLDPNVPYIASLIDTADMVVNAIPGLHLSYEIPLRVSTGIQGTFNLNSNDLHNIANEACFFIEDLHLDSLFDLRNMPFGYDFHLDDTTTAPRFVLHIGRQDSIQAENISCFGSNNGSLQIDGNGWGPWDLTISNSQGIVHNVNQLTTTDTVVNLSPGWYFVDIQSAQLGCNNVNDSIFIDEPALLVIDSLGGSKPSCDNASNASMHIVASGGTGVLNLLWSNGSTADSLFDLNSGTYSLSVTDDNQCLSVDSFIIEDPGSINISLDSLINLQCANDNSGAISLVAIGNTSPYTFNWSNGGSSQNLSSLSSGTYSVTVTDVLGCMDTLMNLSVSEPLPLLISVDSIDHIGCDGLSDGLIIASSIGGTLPLTYTWSNGAQGLVADSLASGTFTVTATDQNGCTSQKAVTVQALATVTADFNVSQDTIELISGGAIVDFTNTSIGATSTHWDFGDGSAFYAVDPSYQYSDTGLYLVTLVASSPDCDDTVSKNVYIKNPASTSINDVFENKMTRVYYSRLLNQFVAEVSGISLPYDLRLLNMNGQMILSHSQVNTSRIEIGNESLSSGTYFISITNDQIQETHKVILP